MPLGHRQKKTMRQPDADLDNVPGFRKNPCFVSMLSLMKTVTPRKTKMNQEEDFVSIGGPFSKPSLVEGPRHHQHGNVLRYVQKAPDDIRWTIDRAEFGELIALKKDSAPGPDGFPYGVYKCAGRLGSQFLFTTYSICWKEVPFLNILLLVGRSLSPSPLTLMTTKELFDLQTRFDH